MRFRRKPPLLHEWVEDGILNETGISTIDEGQWARKTIHCVHCGESRKVWHLLDLDDPILKRACPAGER